MKQQTVEKTLNNASNEEIFECAKEMIENHQFVFKIWNNGRIALGVNAFKNISEGYLTTGKSCKWADFNDSNPDLWDEFDVLYPEYADIDSEEEDNF